ncbi:L-malyl-CoA/beta-methylmalyl-CoA lyase [Natronobacterium gregoryi]|uniref:Citrate lyase beta subunit n=2 Tax=Natronobacterium gregoryi TaxID=44930 RepID=L0AM21_NATGS|nr:L-malyl-CoA/beta-methylmalyl-CoA lyase [Natronobacterium gregoryi]AFZ74504.1 citrate lyase beta subunit [Natronobacterium gregoryi SP2]ELY72422.1 HpcH/HpaI aldolase [Natronobacterium gregoryi SP2]PLK21750.1 citrate lyase subunit beta [Natronobacterium gregoryi SP2]SFI98216.1 beta-methylmalyl-CoA/(S)-malyl-CoA lyase [Natronobacterium gregoryi]
MTDDIRLCRTFQTAPAAVPKDDSAKYLTSGLEAEGFQAPDWLVPDLEDGTAPDMKEQGLENTIENVPEYEFPGEIWPRVEWSYEDETYREKGRAQIDRLVSEVGDEIDGVVVPKVGRLEDVQNAAKAVAEAESEHGYADGSIGLSIIIETGRARSDLREIAQFGEDSRLTALVFGPVDYAAELGGRDLGDGMPRWDGLLEALSNEASAGGLLSIGGPFDDLFKERAGLTYYNADEYADQVEHEARLGLDGSWSLYPKQTIQANTVHMPTPEELERDVNKIERFNEAKREGTGAVTLDGQMVDEATFKNFRNTVQQVRAIYDTRPEQAEEYYDEGLLERALELELSYQ